MAGNTFGKNFRVSTFGESHGPAIGGVIDGMPSGVSVDLAFIQEALDRRKPGQSVLTTARKESDTVEILSGVFEGKTTGTSIGFIIKNADARSHDYSHISQSYRPSHADYTYQARYGIRDYRGGGRSSARETACRVVAGAFAQLWLNQFNISILAAVKQVGAICATWNWHEINRESIEANELRCPDPATTPEMIQLIKAVKKDGDTIGGVVSCNISGLPAGLGDPVFDRFHAQLGKAMLSINAVKGFQYGMGFDHLDKRGSELNDAFYMDGEQVRTRSNNSGGVQGGITNGADVYFDVAFKPVATIVAEQESVNQDGESVSVKGRGRHDPCVLPRAVPIVEAMAALVCADFMLGRTK